jgi:hypothetical protein
MKILSSRTHGVLDYLVGLLLIVSPWLFDFAQHGAETWIFVALGAGAILYSLLTRYEMGVVGLIPFKAHLAIDVMSGILLAASPWLFGFADYVYLPHVIFGVLEIGVALITAPVPATPKNQFA